MPLLDTTREIDADGRSVIKVTGEIDLATAHDLVTAATAPTGERDRLLLDLSGVSFIDSTGISALLEIRRSVESAGGRVELAASSPAVDKVLAVAGITDLFDPAASEQAAESPEARE